MNEILNSQSLMIALLAVIITSFISLITYILYKKIKIYRYDFKEQRAQIEQVRSSLEKELYKINERLSADSERWRDINHLLIRKEYTEDKPLKLNKKVVQNDFLKANGITSNDLQIDKDLIFVLTPFNDKFVQEYETIRNICSDVGFKCVRGDEKYFDSDIFPEMLKLIVKANLIIANINGKNPNVLYELGICQALDKSVILIAKNPENLPIDIKSKRFLVYETIQELTKLLKDELIKLLKTQVAHNENDNLNKTLRPDQWKAQAKKSNFQWTDYKEIDLLGFLLESISCSITPESEYMRFGFKIMDKKAAILGNGGILSPDNSLLLHIGKDINSPAVGATFYKGITLEKNVAVLPDSQQGDQIHINLVIDRNNQLQFFINGNEAYKTVTNYDTRERLFLMAWGDNNDFKLTVKDIEIGIR